MRSLLFLFLAFPFIAAAEPVQLQKQVICDRTSVIMKELTLGEYKEIPVWVGNADDSYYSLLVNEKTQTFTLIQFTKSTACVLGDGKGFKFQKDLTTEK